jgi:TPR repeat protein
MGPSKKEAYFAYRGWESEGWKSGAIKWYHFEAERGNADAQYVFGFCFANGWGVKQNNAEAAKWFRKAAEQGNTKAKDRLKNIKILPGEEENKGDEPPPNPYCDDEDFYGD